MNNLMYFESHAHYDDKQFKGAGPEIVKELKAFGIEKIVVPAITLESNYEARKMFGAEEFSYVYFATGIHPKVASYTRDENVDWESFEALLKEKRTVAIKTGLDLHNPVLGPAHIKNQKAIMEHLFRLASKYDLPVVLHVRDANELLLEELEKIGFEGKIEVHCFLYDKQFMNGLMKAGVSYFGIGGAVTHEAHEALRDAVSHMPLSSVLLETDAPYMRPAEWHERLNTSKTLPQIAAEIAALKGVSVEQAVDVTYKNACKFFSV